MLPSLLNVIVVNIISFLASSDPHTFITPSRRFLRHYEVPFFLPVLSLFKKGSTSDRHLDQSRHSLPPKTSSLSITSIDPSPNSPLPLAMAMELTWSLHYCLACDKQTQDEAYCSQSCRLADLENSSDWSGPSSPTNAPSSDTSKSSAFYLTPAINFSAYGTSTLRKYNAADQATSPSTSYFSSHSTIRVATTKTITPSTSSSSLSSTKSASTQVAKLSEQARNELLDYTNSFDNVRYWKRRVTSP